MITCKSRASKSSQCCGEGKLTRFKRKVACSPCICDATGRFDHCGDREYEAERSRSGGLNDRGKFKSIHADLALQENTNGILFIGK